MTKTITFTIMQLVILDELITKGGCNWKQIKAAVEAHGFKPVDWLTQVRGPLQALIDEGRVVRVEKPEELYQLKERQNEDGKNASDGLHH